tara:strand:+ start:314 stop:493 length:180 start_codon:yes stop_codon:yes gene_type:complete
MTKIIEGWVVWDAEDWSADYSNIYPTKEQAIEAAKKHYSYIGDDDIDESCVCEVKIRIH